MSIIFGIFLTLAILTLVVFIHEMGHFLTARLTKMKVEEFGIGIPPKAKGLFRDKKGTEYTLNWLPIGGFVRIKGEDPGSDEASAKDSFSSKKWWARVLVLIAGVTMNFVLAWLIFSGLLYQGSSPLSVNTLSPKDYGSYFLPSFDEAIETSYITHSGISLTPILGGPASDAGVLSGSIIVSIDGQKISSVEEFIKIIKTNQPIALILENSDGKEYSASLLPKDGKIQAYLKYVNMRLDTDFRVGHSLTESIGKGFRETVALSHMTLDLLGTTLRNLIAPATEKDREQAKEMVAGPIGMGAGMVDMVEFGLSWKLVLLITALLSVNLGVLNILPFPALDGGRIVSTSVMSLFGLFTPKKSFLISLERWVHSFGMILLIGLSLFIAFLDILKL